MLDLGSGGGLPGLVLATGWRNTHAVLLEASERRGAFLVSAVEALGLRDHVDVVVDRAEHAARRDGLRHAFDLVTARSFGPPAVTGECAIGFLRPGGRLLVSEPPDSVRADRWPPDGLAELGLSFVGLTRAEGGTIAVLQSVTACPGRFPRRTGIPAKRPLF
jgi:16S rRNA (guanine527-N7)-methyltransferase